MTRANTGFQDRYGKAIKVGDRIKSIQDGAILVIDKARRACSPLGFKYDLATGCGPVSRGLNEKNEAFAHLTTWELTDAPAPAKPQGPTVSPGDDAQNMAPDYVRDPRNASLKKENWKKNQLTWEDMKAIVNIADQLLDNTEMRIAVANHSEQEYYTEVLRKFKEGER